MKYLTKNDLKMMMLSSYEKMEESKEEINRINVFPVPDQDTGDNMAVTLLGVKKAIEKKDFQNLKELSEAILEGALESAQGNSGVIFTGFLAGFLLSLQNKNPINAERISEAFFEGAKKARLSIQAPKEGTMLDVIEATAESLIKEVQREKDIIKLLQKGLEKAKEVLLTTQEKMDIFKKAQVVDAGGLAYVMILEGFLEALKGEKRKEQKRKEERKEEEEKRFIQMIPQRYEVISLIKEPKVSVEEMRKKLKVLGDWLDIIQVREKVKVHLHTDFPEEVEKVMREMGKIESLRIEDITKEIEGEKKKRDVSIGIVTENLASLLPEILGKYSIELVEAKFNWPEIEELPGKSIYQKIKEAWRRGVKSLPKTSQASPLSYLTAFKKQLEKFKKILCLSFSSALSGCYNSALQAREMLGEEEKRKVFVLDTKNGASGQALLVLRSIELIQEGREIEEIIEELKSLIPLTHTYVIFKDPKGVEFLGRITKSQANWIRRMKRIGIHPLMEVKDGKIEKGGVIFARGEAKAIFKKILKESKQERKKGKRMRAVVNHADNEREAERVKEMLKEIGVEVPYVAEGPPLICAVTGPGTLIVGWHAL
ncbi:MAG TPA: DegV family EDD domain-containing protein [bacterium]|nr:DegV family EDD domain-containing protein [bacterium]HEX67670.1 DegV family EDD domain-containing protein [bacterium]